MSEEGNDESPEYLSGTLRIVVLGLVIVALTSIFSVTLLAFSRRSVPDALIGIGSAAVGALATLVARVGNSR
jgi:hypothetical protein